MPNVQTPPWLLYTFLKSISISEVLYVIPLFTSQSDVKNSIHPVLGSKILTA